MVKVLVALDFPETAMAASMARSLTPHVAGFKVGLELILNDGPGAISEIAALGLPVFADVKLHDIPNTVGAAAKAIARHGARWVTAHAGGGREMIEAACDGFGAGRDESGVLVVTVLTSLNDADLRVLGMTGAVSDYVAAMATLAAAAGAEGAVCGPLQVARVKEVAPSLTVVTPGIREARGEKHDQKQVATPAAALAAGADYLVVGRAITRAADPVAAALSISAQS